MKKKICIIYILFCCTFCRVHAQSIGVADVLRNLGMENISVVQKQDTITAAFETSVYRGTYHGIDMAIRHLISIPTACTLQLVILDNALPQLCITLPAELITNYQTGISDLVEIYRRMGITTSTGPAMKELKGTKPEHRSFGKPDLVLYPGVVLINDVLYKLYRVAIDIRPAVEMQLWKGASLRAQVYLPLINNESGKWDYIRPGFLTLRQDFRFAHHWKGYLAAGNFSNDRQGAAGAFGYFSANDRWSVEGEGGITGSSHLYGSDWWVGKWKRINGLVRIGYYVPQLNTRLIVEGGRFLYGDYGVRGTLSRYFGEYMVGVYAMHTAGEKNAGFRFSIPLPGKKRSRTGSIRVMLPDYFAFQYDMRSGNEYARRRLGEDYRTEPKSAEDTRFWQPDYIRYYLIRTNEKKLTNNEN